MRSYGIFACSKGQLNSKGLFCFFNSSKNLQKISTKAKIGIFKFVFWKNLRHQIDIIWPLVRSDFRVFWNFILQNLTKRTTVRPPAAALLGKSTLYYSKHVVVLLLGHNGWKFHLYFVVSIVLTNPCFDFNNRSRKYVKV